MGFVEGDALLIISFKSAGPDRSSSACTITMTLMAETAKVDLVGVGLNAIDTLIPLVHFPSRGSKTEYTQCQHPARRARPLPR